MKLQGIILPTSLAVSTPTIVPAGALWVTVKLLIVIVMNLSGGAICLANEWPVRSLESATTHSLFFISANLATNFVLYNN